MRTFAAAALLAAVGLTVGYVTADHATRPAAVEAAPSATVAFLDAEFAPAKDCYYYEADPVWWVELVVTEVAKQRGIALDAWAVSEYAAAHCGIEV
jgi:hypothetical protein